MSVVTIQSFTVPHYQGTEPIKLRIIAKDRFITSDGKQILSGDRKFYKEITCSLAANVITVPSFTIDTTDDSSNPNARYTGYFIIPNRRNKYLFENFEIPTSLGATPTWTAVRLHNETTVALDNPETTYSQTELNILLAQYLQTAKLLTKQTTANQTWLDDTALVNTGLSATVEAGGHYNFEAILFVTTGATGGFKCKIDGTSTDTNFIAQFLATTSAGAAINGGRAAGRATALSTTGQATFVVRIFGSVEINAGGTFLVQAAQAVEDNVTTTLLRGSSLVMRKTN